MQAIQQFFTFMVSFVVSTVMAVVSFVRGAQARIATAFLSLTASTMALAQDTVVTEATAGLTAAEADGQTVAVAVIGVLAAFIGFYLVWRMLSRGKGAA